MGLGPRRVESAARRSRSSAACSSRPVAAKSAAYSIRTAGSEPGISTAKATTFTIWPRSPIRRYASLRLFNIRAEVAVAGRAPSMAGSN